SLLWLLFVAARGFVRRGARRQFLLDLFGDASLACVVRYVPPFAFELDGGRRNQFLQTPPALATARRRFSGRTHQHLGPFLALLTTIFVDWHAWLTDYTRA